ncbi:MAG TPA: ABC transporter permease [Verrucomicrobiota bacterium]|nr:FtsX-like permease family protein [Verrucomicrobiota bacterium]HOK77126.1 ABC transporter permease [Verrucomicrobiota bacterium]
MMFLATFRVAVRALRRNPLRTLLTMLGIIIGVGAVIAMVSIGNGAKAQVEAQIATLGQNVLLVLSGNVTRGGFGMGFGSAGTLTKEDYEALRREIPGIAGVSPEVRGFAQIAAGNQNINTQVLGVGTDYITIRAWPLASGVNFTEQDIRSANKVALIGKTTAQTLFGDMDPVGQIIRIKSAPFTVIGALSSKGMSMMGSDQDDVVLVPYTSAMRRLTGATTFRSLTVQASSAAVVPEVQNQITELLRLRHRIQPGRDDDFLVRSQQEITDMATSTSRTMRQLLAAVAGISLLVGGIGVMNIMLVSVTERTREIGVRMAVGARGRDIMLQFLTEAITLSLTGGVIGVLLGVYTPDVLNALSETTTWPALTSPDSIVLAFCVSAAVGILFGLYPAWKASQLDPIEALRYE